MPLRPYQEELVQKVRDAYLHGKRAPCIVLPCGGGKSVIVAEIAKRTTQKGNRVLFLVHRIELCEQIENTFRKWGVDMSLCDVMMVQTATRRIETLPYPALIITDENHHSLARTYRSIYEAFPKARRIGVTATPKRLDGSGLGDVNDELIIGVSVKWLIAHNFLAPFDYFSISLINTANLKIKMGEYDIGGIENLFLERGIYGNIIENYREKADGKQAICYCASVKLSKQTAERFREAEIEATHIDGNTPKEERERIINGFREGKIKILCNVDLISEGFDVPDCECVILLRPTMSLTLFIQQAMRCMRYKPGKRAIILDHVVNCKKHGLPDQDRVWELNPKKKKKNQAEDVLITECPFCYYVFDKFDEHGERVMVCPNCGNEIISESKEGKGRGNLDEIDAKLEKITGFVLNLKTPEECQTYGELLEYAKDHSYKPGWAYYQAKARGIL